MSWLLQVVGIWFAFLTGALLLLVGYFWLYDLLEARRDRRYIAAEECDTYDAAMERFRRQAHRLGSFAEQLEEIQSLPEARR